MSDYAVRLTSHANAQLRKLDRLIQKRLSAAINGLAQEPRPDDSKTLSGAESLWRIRVGAYRIVYSIDDGVLLVLVIKLGHRRSVYRRLD